QRRQLAESLECFERILAIDPGHFGARVEIGHGLRELGRLPEAEAAFRALLGAAPGHVGALAGLGSLLIDLFRLDDAQTTLGDLRDRAPDSPQAQLGLGYLARRRGDRAAALACFEVAAALVPLDVRARLEVAAERRDRGDFAESERQLRSILDRQPDNLAALVQRGHLLRRRGDREAAFHAFEEVWTRHSRHTPALVEMAVDARALGWAEESMRLLGLARERDPESLPALLQCVEHALLMEDFEAASALCLHAMAAHPASLQPLLIAARAHADWALMDQARALLERARRTFGDHPEVRAQEIELARQSGDHERMRNLVESAAGDARRFFPLWAQSVRFAIDTGAYEAAEEAARRPPATNTFEAAHAHALSGRLAEAQGNHRGALDRYGRALALNPLSHVHFEMALASLMLLDVEAVQAQMKRSIEVNRTSRMLRGEPMRVSQTHVGQLLDEFALDRPLLDRLKAISREPAEGQVDLLRGLVAANPDHTPAAIRLVLALRRSGRLGTGAPASPLQSLPGAIPKRIAQYWDSARPPGDVAALMRSWTELNPGHDYRLFDDASASRYLRARAAPEVLKAFRRAAHPAQRADVFRLAYLAAEGGFYADSDDRCIAPLSSWTPSSARFVGYVEDYGTIANNCLAAAPGHPVIALALASAAEAINRGDADMLWLSTGPGLLTRAFARVAAAGDGLASTALRDSHLLDLGAIRRSVAIHCHLGYKKSNRHWSRAEFKRNAATDRRPVLAMTMRNEALADA
ncbi:MAG: tetratricopeptide repeat protein, partial [Roseiarcus sp.]